MMIFTALPNMFFGFENSESDEIIHMTEQAKVIGSSSGAIFWTSTVNTFADPLKISGLKVIRAVQS